MQISRRGLSGTRVVVNGLMKLPHCGFTSGVRAFVRQDHDSSRSHKIVDRQNTCSESGNASPAYRAIPNNALGWTSLVKLLLLCPVALLFPCRRTSLCVLTARKLPSDLIHLLRDNRGRSFPPVLKPLWSSGLLGIGIAFRTPTSICVLDRESM